MILTKMSFVALKIWSRSSSSNLVLGLALARENLCANFGEATSNISRHIEQKHFQLKRLACDLEY